MRRRRSSAALAAFVVLAALPAGASAATFEAYAGGDQAKGLPKQASPNAFYPRALRIRVGDTVTWRFRGFHSVTFPVRGEGPPPLVLATTDKPVSGVADAAGNPFWFNGQPNLPLDPVGAQKSTVTRYNGSAVLGSGLPLGARPKPFSLRFRRAGTFLFSCVVHPGMRGRVHVVRTRRGVRSPAAQEAVGERQLARDVRAAKRLVAAPSPSGAGATVGVGRTSPAVAVYKMFPRTLTVAAGQPVTFTMAGEFRSEVHTVTFGPEKLRASIEKNFVEPLPAVGAGALGLNPQGAYPSDQPPALPSYDGTNHGDGFLNTGLLDNDPSTPFRSEATITFTKPGTYDYECVIHEHMDGRIVVT
jgi:plastocyanin